MHEAGIGEHEDAARYDMALHGGGFGYREHEAALDKSLSALSRLLRRDGHAGHNLQRQLRVLCCLKAGCVHGRWVIGSEG